METFEHVRTYITTKLRDYSEGQSQWNGNLIEETQHLLDIIEGYHQLEHTEYELKDLKNKQDFTIEMLVDIMNGAMEVLEEDSPTLAQITVSSNSHPTISLSILIAFIDFYFQYNIGNIELVKKDNETVLYILKFVDNEDELDGDIDTNIQQVIPSRIGASKLCNTLEHFYEQGYTDVEFTMLLPDNVSLIFQKNNQ